MMIVAKYRDRVVEIVRVADTVAFSEERGWICICFDFEKISRKREQFRWMRVSDVRFDWVREFVGE